MTGRELIHKLLNMSEQALDKEVSAETYNSDEDTIVIYKIKEVIDYDDEIVIELEEEIYGNNYPN